MTPTQQAIQLSIRKGGWKKNSVLDSERVEMEPMALGFRVYQESSTIFNAYILAETYLDPLFWQALGKALGWHDTEKCKVCDPYDGAKCREYYKNWTVQMHRFIDHIITGKSADEFFKKIIK